MERVEKSKLSTESKGPSKARYSFKASKRIFYTPEIINSTMFIYFITIVYDKLFNSS